MPHICKARQGKPLHGPADTAPGTLGSIGRNSRSLAPETNLGKGRPQLNSDPLGKVWTGRHGNGKTLPAAPLR
jgi:hypothetical protein